MAKINGLNWSDEIPKKHTRQEFIGLYGSVNRGGCKDLGALYDKIVELSGVTPKIKKKSKRSESKIYASDGESHES